MRNAGTIAALVLAALIIWRLLVQTDWAYVVAREQPRPPGYPSGVRPTGARGSASSLVAFAAQRTGLGPAFVACVQRLADNESQATVALPAHSFNFTVEARNAGRAITAWGVFQYNAAAWRRLTGGLQRYPWLATCEQEISLPIEREYAHVWRRAKGIGASDYYAERAVRLWHMAPAYVDGFLARAAADGFAVAWQAVPTYTTRSGRTVDPRSTIDRKLA